MTTVSDTQYLANATSIAVGKTVSGVILGNGENVVTAGENTYGQLGIGSDDETGSARFRKVDFTNVKNIKEADASADPPVTAQKEKAVKLAAGDNHMVMLTDGEHVYAWGDNSRGQLGQGDNLQDQNIAMTDMPKQVKKGNSYSSDGKYLENIWNISASKNNTTAVKHDVVLANETGKDDIIGEVVWAWGENAERQLGNQIDKQGYMPVQAGERETRRVVALLIKKINGTDTTDIELTVNLADASLSTKDKSVMNMPEITITKNEYLNIIKQTTEGTSKIWEIYERGFLLEGDGERFAVTNPKFSSSNTRVIEINKTNTDTKVAQLTPGETLYLTEQSSL